MYNPSHSYVESTLYIISCVSRMRGLRESRTILALLLDTRETAKTITGAYNLDARMQQHKKGAGHAYTCNLLSLFIWLVQSRRVEMETSAWCVCVLAICVCDHESCLSDMCKRSRLARMYRRIMNYPCHQVLTSALLVVFELPTDYIPARALAICKSVLRVFAATPLRVLRTCKCIQCGVCCWKVEPTKIKLMYIYVNDVPCMYTCKLRS